MFLAEAKSQGYIVSVAPMGGWLILEEDIALGTVFQVWAMLRWVDLEEAVRLFFDEN